MPAPLLSVLIPTHDRPALLREAIESVVKNGMDDFEVIVSDDSPSGSAGAVVSSFTDARIKYIRYSGGAGKAGNWEHAILKSSGKYVFKLDDDDRIRPGFLQRCAEVMEADSQVGSVYTGHVIYWPDGRTEEIIDTDFFAQNRSTGERYLRAVLANEGGYPRTQKTAAVFRRAIAERIGFYREASEDFAFSAALGLGGDVAYVPEALYEWRIHPGSGVRDLNRTWQLSHEACEGLLRLPRELLPPTVQPDWERLVRTAQDALPLFYLRAAFIDLGWSEGWKFWRTWRETGRGANRPVVWVCLLVATVTPRPVLRKFFEWYQRNRLFQGLISRAIARRPRS